MLHTQLSTCSRAVVCWFDVATLAPEHDHPWPTGSISAQNISQNPPAGSERETLQTHANVTFNEM